MKNQDSRPSDFAVSISNRQVTLLALGELVGETVEIVDSAKDFSLRTEGLQVQGRVGRV